MVKTSDIVFSLIKEFKSIFPQVKIWEVGNVSEGIRRPSFLFYVSFENNRQQSYMTATSRVVVQIIYFGNSDGYSQTNYQENFDTIEKAKEFLDKHNLNVDDRNLKFDYEIGNADGSPMFTVNFAFNDSVKNNYAEKQKQATAQKVIYNKEELI